MCQAGYVSGKCFFFFVSCAPSRIESVWRFCNWNMNFVEILEVCVVINDMIHMCMYIGYKFRYININQPVDLGFLFVRGNLDYPSSFLGGGDDNGTKKPFLGKLHTPPEV